MKLTKRTRDELIEKAKAILGEGQEIQERYAQLQAEAEALETIVGADGVGEALREFRKSSQIGPPDQDKPFSSKVVSALREIGEPASPATITKKIQEAGFTQSVTKKSTVNALVNSELGRLVRRRESGVKKVGKGLYVLEEKPAGESAGS